MLLCKRNMSFKSRRKLNNIGCLAIFFIFFIGLIFVTKHLLAIQSETPKDGRPPTHQRLFTSSSVEMAIQKIAPQMKDPELALLFVNCFPNTLDSTVYYNGDPEEPDTFVITGDIEAMWLRDSSAQVLPYVQFAEEDNHLKSMLKGLIRRQIDYINLDSYANAFNDRAYDTFWHRFLESFYQAILIKDVRFPPVHVLVWEGKYEIDSLAWAMRLSARYFKETKDTSICTPQWMAAMEKIALTITYQQQSLDTMNRKDSYFYSFQRNTNTQSETLQGGVGVPSKVCGLSRAGFRPSDDAHQFPFQVAGNCFAQVTLNEIASILQTPGQCYNESLSSILSNLANELKAGIDKEGIVSTPGPTNIKIFAYEVDGFGSRLLMDDANVPSLLSLPYIGYLESNDTTYLATRETILSYDNPYYFCGGYGCGIGSPHTGLNRIWPMSLIMQALTSSDDREIASCLNMLKVTTAGKNFIHESFEKDNPQDFTRSWFSWANSMFGELIIKLSTERPHLIF